MISSPGGGPEDFISTTLPYSCKFCNFISIACFGYSPEITGTFHLYKRLYDSSTFIRASRSGRPSSSRAKIILDIRVEFSKKMADGWQAYIKNLMDNAPSVIKKAAIVGLSDATIWARSEPPIGETFNASTEELQKISRLFQTNDGYKDAPMTGIVVEGVKYLVPLAQETLIFGKKAKGGVFVAKTNTALLIALFSGETGEGQVCRSAVERVANYLQGQGY